MMTVRRKIRPGTTWSCLLASLLLLAFVQPAIAEPGPAPAAEARANLPQLEEEVMCPVCGTLLGLSRAPAAERQRAYIRSLIRKGQDEDQIKAALVAEYGPQVLALPEDEETDVFVYLVPLVGLVGGALLVLLAAVSWRRKTGRELPDVEGPEGPRAERLDRDLDRFGP
ncbi:MAG: cytochrome c-type biogenesis protein [Solirubrobacterales bacterium]